MNRRIADTLKRTARWLLKLANRIDGPTITYYDKSWHEIVDRNLNPTRRGQRPALPNQARR